MDKLTEKRYIRIIYLSLTASVLYGALHAGDRVWALLFLAGLLVLSVTVRHMLLLPRARSSLLGSLTYLPDTALAFLIGLFAGTEASVAFFLIVLCDACLFLPRAAGYAVAALAIVSYAIGPLLGASPQTLQQALSSLSFVEGVFLAAVALVSITRYEMETRQQHDRMLYDLKTKSRELEDAYRKLREVAQTQQEMAALQERTRIAREMHDTVGHALTGGLLSLEAGERLLGQDGDQAAQRIGQAKENIRKGLTELRRAVHTLGAEESDLVAAMHRLLRDLRGQGISIHEDMPALPKLSAQKQNVLLRALQEGLTNGLRHGGSTAFVFRLRLENGNVSFLLEDNGRGCGAVTPGFGLRTMEQRVTAAGGCMAVHSDPGEGFRIEITLPAED